MRKVITALVGLLALAAQGGASAQDNWPSRPIRLIVPFAPGGNTDAVARVTAEYMQTALKGASVIVENRGGAGGIVGTEAVAKAPPDGYTLCVCSIGSITIAPALEKLPYDVLRDLSPVALTAASPLALVVHPSLPPRDPPGFIAWAKASGGRVSYSSGGVGNISHLLSFLVLRHIGAEATHVPYRGTAAALTDTAAGNVQFTSDTVVTALPVIQEGRVRAIAVSSAARTPLLPEVPSMAEAGMMPPGFEVGAWQGIMAPARTPPEAVARLNAAVRAALADPEARARLAAQGAQPTGGTPEDYARYLREEVERWARVVAESGATAE